MCFGTLVGTSKQNKYKKVLALFKRIKYIYVKTKKYISVTTQRKNIRAFFGDYFVRKFKSKAGKIMISLKIKDWLDECDKEEVLPWLYDFKNETLIEGKQHENPIIRIFEWYMNSTNKYKVCEIENTELAKEIYSSLWNIKRELIFSEYQMVDIDVMNSFWNSYKKDIEINKRIKINKWCDGNINKETFEELTKNYNNYSETNERFYSFAERTHTIGNFIIEPRGFNVGRQNGDYWDLGLKLMKDYFDCLTENTTWKSFVTKYNMESFVNNDNIFSVSYFWNRGENVHPVEVDQIDEFLNHVNMRIEERGKQMIKKLCEKNELTEYNFYKKHLKYLEIKFANEMFG